MKRSHCSSPELKTFNTLLIENKWCKVTKYIYSSTLLQDESEVLCLHISEDNNVFFFHYFFYIPALVMKVKHESLCYKFRLSSLKFFSFSKTDSKKTASLSGSSSTGDLQVVLLDQNFTTTCRSVQQSIHWWSITLNREGSSTGGNKDEDFHNFSVLSHNYNFLSKINDFLHYIMTLSHHFLTYLIILTFYVVIMTYLVSIKLNVPLFFF